MDTSQDALLPAAVANAPFKPLGSMPRDLHLEHRPDGVILMRSQVEIGAHEPTLAGVLRREAAAHPERTWLAQRRGPERAWQRLSYQQAQAMADRVTQSLLDLGQPERPVLILSGSSLEHAVLKIAAMQARMPCVPVSPAYSLQTPDVSRLQEMLDLVRPALVFAQNAAAYRRPLADLRVGDAKWLFVDEVPHRPDVIGWEAFAAAEPGAQVQASIERITPETVVQYLFTSGSTGMPKAVTMTQRMLAASLAIHRGTYVKSPDEPPSVQLDWLPWNHVAGGTAVFWSVLSDGGTVHIDEGRPTPEGFQETIRNLREIAPSSFGSVPVGYALLVEALEREPRMAELFFSRLKRLTYSGARLPEPIFNRMQALAVRHTGMRIPFVSAFGSTETSAAVMASYWGSEHAGCVGLPQPGVELKLLPLGQARYEVRVRSPAVTPGYLGQPDLSRECFDEEGFFRMGDALEFVDPAQPREGMFFSGRVTEEFKLQSGIFVRVGELRVRCIEAAQGLLADVVVAGADQPYIALLAWPHVEACSRRAGQSLDMATLARAPWLREAVREAFEAYNRDNPASSRRVERILLLAEPPSMGAGEITDKGYVNQRAVLKRREAEVASLYLAVPPADVITID